MPWDSGPMSAADETRILLRCRAVWPRRDGGGFRSTRVRRGEAQSESEG